MVAIAAVAGYNVYQSQSVMNGMSDFALANVEALASSSEKGPHWTGYAYNNIKNCCEYQSWDFFGRNDTKAETPVLWPPHAKS